ncbi:hypothetical protein GCM10011351_27070 [Paraliobacillus quinghaiensis]|uniref:XRE family transcriptional regulator n=1 Tax=Paraliobacillus quinghaiensis TaxID=470815 RepID=A0A917TV58_9BACI|nr:hypothetical protein [Paraliobacillus quinghaiensis]GGM39492.1 hypothetical protein GCM10011351_27070 [Paraliobacillus quinghaiensis]
MKADEIKQMIKSSGLKQWQVAEFYGITEGNFSRLLRKDPTKQTVVNIKKAIEKAREVYVSE